MATTMPVVGPRVYMRWVKSTLAVYENAETLPPLIKSGSFQHVGWFDLDTIDPNDDIWYQDGIREEGAYTKEREETFENSYETKGWLTKYIPPMFTLCGKPKGWERKNSFSMGTVE